MAAIENRTPRGPVAQVQVTRVRGDDVRTRRDRVASEEPLEIRAAGPGQTVNVGVVRFGAKKVFPVKLIAVQDEESVARATAAGRPSPEAVSYDKLGVAVAPIPAELARRSELGDQYRRVLIVTDVKIGGPAYKKLIDERDIIVEILNPSPRRAVSSQSEL